jgi:glycosyltransferase involved in cell wall biosynthesis
MILWKQPNILCTQERAHYHWKRKNMATPFFTVIIPAYNRANLLREAIQSVFDQTFKDFELIVVDDYSTDHTAETVCSFEDERVHYVVNDHSKGVAGARNAGIFRAQGEWIAFLDADDVWLPEKLKRLFEKIQKVDAEIGLIYTGHVIYDFDKKQEGYVFVPVKEGWIQNDLLYQNCIGTFSGVAINAKLLKAVGGCDERFLYYEDNDLYVRIAGIAKVSLIEEKLSYVRVSNDDRLAFKFEIRLHAYQMFWKKYSEIINQNRRLRHRAASRVFLYAAKLRKWREMFDATPWTLAGLFVDVNNSWWLFRCLASFLYRQNQRAQES